MVKGDIKRLVWQRLKERVKKADIASELAKTCKPEDYQKYLLDFPKPVEKGKCFLHNGILIMLICNILSGLASRSLSSSTSSVPALPHHRDHGALFIKSTLAVFRAEEGHPSLSPAAWVCLHNI